MKKIYIIFCFSICLLYPAGICADNVSVINKGDSIILSNKNIELVFSNNETYKMYGMKFMSKQMLPVGGINAHPWEITYIGTNGENPLLKPQNGYYKGVESKVGNDYASLVFTWQMLLTAGKTHEVRMIVEIEQESDLAEWNIEADLPEGWIVSFIDFPRITIERPANAKAILPAGWGSEYVLNDNTSISSRYPSGTGTMQLVLMHNNKECFYYATKDMDASDKRYKMDCAGKNITIHTQTTTSEGWSPRRGGTFRLPWATVVGYCVEGWEAAVTKWYRPFTYTTQWGSKTLQSRNLPKWIYEADVWLRPMNVNENVMESIRKAIKLYGKGVGLHWYYWHHYPFDTKYPEYFPAKDGFVQMVEETKKLGGYVTPYINGRLWDPATESYSKLDGNEASCRKSDGTLYTEVYSSKVINTVTCPASSIWQGIQKDVIWRIQDEIGTSGVYVDQVAAAPSEPCWAENHGHAKGGGEFWVKAYRELYKDIRDNHLKRGNILTSEENAECYIDLFDMLLIVNSPIRTSNLVPLFPLVYSDRVITSAFAYTPAALTNGSFRYLNMMSLLWGAQLGWVDPTTLMKENSEEEALFLKEMMLFRKKHHDFFNGGQFIKEFIPVGDNPEKYYPNYAKSPVVRGAIWKDNKNKRQALFLVNVDNVEHIIKLPTNKELKIEAKKCVSIDVTNL